MRLKEKRFLINLMRITELQRTAKNHIFFNSIIIIYIQRQMKKHFKVKELN